MKRQKKSIMVLITLLLMFASVMSACGTGAGNDESSPSTNDEPNSKDSITLRMTVWGSPDEVAAYKFGIQRFEENHPNIKVDLQHIAADYDTKLTTMVAGNDVPDIAMMESGSIATHSQSKGSSTICKSFSTKTRISMWIALFRTSYIRLNQAM
ncbi:extracellular solute-binding protein [Paenibacillus sp. JCM 10914]|uniref:extracellular solute-binding protein n=1 Tax=Paenibacillus sp. JCM 10914 TaxID=1236974 RepID=UPI0003CCB1CF|nr:extracellular solute-binding protein [Paenibacillus sp. JCM 10914]GAE09815.1 hypothetical protein JCM10914_6205 [Paenibacillus sp. JCM 10914]